MNSCLNLEAFWNILPRVSSPSWPEYDPMINCGSKPELLYVEDSLEGRANLVGFQF